MKLLRGEGPPLRIGHRGAAALAPENTLESLRSAVEHGVDLVEFDVLPDVDDRLVLAHSLLELPRARTTLEDALGLLGAAGVGVHVDLKQRGVEERLVAALRGHGVVARSLVSCVDPAALRELRRLEPALALGLAYPEDRYGIGRRRALSPLVACGLAAMKRTLPRLIVHRLERARARVAVLHQALVTPALVARCHASGNAVFAWTVNDAEVAARLSNWGADAIITDDPRILGPT